MEPKFKKNEIVRGRNIGIFYVEDTQKLPCGTWAYVLGEVAPEPKPTKDWWKPYPYQTEPLVLPEYALKEFAS